MKRWQLLKWPTALLTIAAIVILSHSPTPPPAPTPVHTQQTRPAWQAQQVQQWHFSPQQQLIYLQAKLATHNQQHQRTHLDQPTGLLIRNDTTYTLRAEQGMLTRSTLRLSGQVRLQRMALNNAHPLVLETAMLHYDHPQQHLSTPETVRITQGPNWTRGTGLDWWLERQTLMIKKDVISEFAPPTL